MTASVGVVVSTLLGVAVGAAASVDIVGLVVEVEGGVVGSLFS